MALTRKERNRNYYLRRIENGLCPRCGNKIDRDGFYCSECLEKSNEYKRKNKEFCRNMGICPVCGKNKLYGDEKNCLECKAKYASRYADRRDKMTENEKIEFNNKRNAEIRNRYKERKEKGICVMCGKRKTAPSRVRCEICLEKNRIQKRKR